MRADFSCRFCGLVVEYETQYKEEFPKSIPGPVNCAEPCKSGDCVLKRDIASPLSVQVAEGLLGNSKNGHRRNYTYKSSTATPLNKEPGRIKYSDPDL